jgi:peptide/nickel transport system ATP-binding protein
VSGPTLLSVEDVAVDLPTSRGNLRAVDGVILTLGAGKTLGIVGESGCGKTMLSRAILQLLPKKAKVFGRVLFDGQDLVRLSPEALRKLRCGVCTAETVAKTLAHFCQRVHATHR